MAILIYLMRMAKALIENKSFYLEKYVRTSHENKTTYFSSFFLSEVNSQMQHAFRAYIVARTAAVHIVVPAWQAGVRTTRAGQPLCAARVLRSPHWTNSQVCIRLL